MTIPMDILAVGPQRTASSWLDQALRAHPQLALPANVKETFFFDRQYDRGWDWYLSHFSEAQSQVLLAEVGSTYFESPEARERIWLANPDTKILITVRNPVARSFSSFGHEYAKGRAPGDFFEAVSALPRIIDSGRYSNLAPAWEREFGRERVLYAVQEDIEANPQGQLDIICAFLGIEPLELPDELNKRYGQGSVPRFRWLAAMAARSASTLRSLGLHRVVERAKALGLKRIFSGGDQKKLTMSRPVFDYLLGEHERDIQFLEEHLGRTFKHWRDPASYGLVNHE